MTTKLDHVSEETRDELASLALTLSGNAKTRKGFLGLVKEAAPGTPIPELDQSRIFDEEIGKRDKKIEELTNSFNDFKLGGQMVEQKNKVMQKYGFSSDDMTKMEEKMGKKELPTDYDFAARLFKQELDVAPPTTYGSSGYGPFALEKNAKSLEGLMENENDWSIATAHSMIDDMQRAGKTPAF